MKLSLSFKSIVPIKIVVTKKLSKTQYTNVHLNGGVCAIVYADEGNVLTCGFDSVVKKFAVTAP